MKKRRWIQIISALLLNGDLLTLWKGIITRKATVSSTPLKNICVPGLNCYSCPSAVGACPIGSLQFYLNDVASKLQLGEKLNLVGFYLLGFFLGTGVIAGRFFCGWICPFGLLQELIHKITGKNRKIPVSITYSRYLVLAIFVFLLPVAVYPIAYLSPWFCKLICPAGTLTAGVPLLLIDPTLWNAASWITALKFAILLFLIVTLLFSNRVFCKTLCPLGAIWGLFHKIAIFRLHYNKEKCTSCGKCDRVCQMNLTVTKEYQSSQCIRCLQCVDVCPTHCLRFGIEKKENAAIPQKIV